MLSSKKIKLFIFKVLIACLPITGLANPHDTLPVINKIENTAQIANKLSGSEQEEERKEYIAHHLLDSHDFHLFSYGSGAHQTHVGFPLLTILWDEGFHIFSSSKFHHGESVAQSGNSFFKINHHDGMVYKTNAQGTSLEHKPLDLSITKNVFMMLFVGLLMFLIFTSLARSYKKNGGIAAGVGRFFEPIVIYVRDEIAIPNIGEKNYKKYMSHLLTVFFFVWFLNMFGLTPLGVNVTGNIAITAALAIITYLITTFTANKNYWKHIFWMPGVPTPMKIVLAPIELLGTIIKPFSLTIRLYANMVAGHIVLMSIIAMMYTFNNVAGSGFSFILAFVLSILEILVAGLQAYIFTMLTALYFGAANEEHHHDEAH